MNVVLQVKVTDPKMTHCGWTGDVVRVRPNGSALVQFHDLDPHFNDGKIPFSLWYKPEQVKVYNVAASA